MSTQPKVFDVAIIGYGPAGITAGIYAARKRLSVLLIGDLPAGEVRNSGDIENWPGDRATDGNALAEKLISHLNDHKDSVSIIPGKAVAVRKEEDTFIIETDGTTYTSKTVVYATGRHPRQLRVPGEKEYKNRGVTYCATCDAPLFPDREVAVIGGGNTGAEAVIMLQKIASKIYLLHDSDTLRADAVLTQNFTNDPKVEILYNTQTTKIEGSQMVEKLTYQDKTSGEEKIINVQGVFVAIGAIPNTEPVKNLVELDAYGAVVADRYGKTSVPGLFAAGDVTDIRDAQIVVAAGHGCSAALSAGDYLSRLK